jgi:hypothetical protein
MGFAVNSSEFTAVRRRSTPRRQHIVRAPHHDALCEVGHEIEHLSFGWRVASLGSHQDTEHELDEVFNDLQGYQNLKFQMAAGGFCSTRDFAAASRVKNL